MLFLLVLFETMTIYMVCVISKIGEILENCQICQNLIFLNDKALVVTPHITKYICYHLSLCDHLFPSVCLPIFPSVARLKPIRIPSNMIVCVPLFHLNSEKAEVMSASVHHRDYLIHSFVYNDILNKIQWTLIIQV